MPAEPYRAITDTTGGNIAGADVKVTNVATGVEIAIKTNDTGNYTVPFLIPGIYTNCGGVTGPSCG